MQISQSHYFIWCRGCLQFARSHKVLLGCTAHLDRFIDKVRLRHAGKIQDYNYITVEF